MSPTKLSASDWGPLGGAMVAGAAVALAAWFGLERLSPAILVPFGLAVACTGAALAAAAILKSRALARQAEKLSGEIDLVSRRLVRLETDLSELGRREVPESRLPVEEVTAEISLLGGLVRDIAVTLAAHDRDIATLKEAPVQPASAAAPPPLPSPGPAAATWGERSASSPLGAIPGDMPPFDRFGPIAPVSAPSVTRPVPQGLPASAVQAAAGSARERGEQITDRQVVEALRGGGRIDLYLQGIVSLPQRKLKMYEASPRLRLPGDERVLTPAEFVPALARAGALPELDRMVLARSAVIARHLGARGSDAVVTCSLSEPAVAVPGFLRAIGSLVEAQPDLSGRLILGLSQRSWRGLDEERLGTLGYLRRLGVGLMLDRATDLRLDPVALADQGVRHVKVAAHALMRAEVGADSDIAAGDLPSVLGRAGITLIADGVEREEDVPDLIEFDAPLAQGGVFAPPRAVRADALAPPAPPAQIAPPPDPGPDDNPERRPFRSFLRRAG